MTQAIDYSIHGRTVKREREALIILAAVTPADLEAADTFWTVYAPEPFPGLLEASHGFQGAKTEFSWSPVHLRYYVKGFAVSDARLRKAVFDTIDAAKGAMIQLTTDLLSGKLPLEQWQAQMENNVKFLHVAVFLVGAGGKEAATASQMQTTLADVPTTPPDTGFLGDIILYQLGRLERFAQQIQDQDITARTPLDIMTRAGLYATSAYPTFMAGRHQAATIAGKTLEHNVLTEAEHCEALPGEYPPDCPSQTARGWVDIGELVPVGLRKCRMNCKCWIQYKSSDDQA
jgi:hypothetical protein